MSGDEGLREAVAKALVRCRQQRGYALGDETNAVLALPEIAGLRAKAAAADRVRELADETDNRARGWAQEADSLPADSLQRYGLLGRILGAKATAQRIRQALDGPSPATNPEGSQ